MDVNHEQSLRYLPNIAHQFLACSHPLLIPLLVKESEFETTMDKVNFNYQTLKAIELKTNFTNLKASDGWGSAGNSHQDHQEIVKLLGSLHANYSYNLLCLITYQEQARFLQAKSKVIDEGVGAERSKAMRRDRVNVEARIEYLQNSLEHAVIFGNIQPRLQAQQGVVSLPP